MEYEGSIWVALESLRKGVACEVLTSQCQGSREQQCVELNLRRLRNGDEQTNRKNLESLKDESTWKEGS